MTSMRFFLATANPDKAVEMAHILSGAGIDVAPRPAHVEDVEETGETLEANAELKARAIAAATGEGAIADDTGLEVDCLGGAPGVFTARYAGPQATYQENCDKLVAELRGVPTADRTARFVTAICIVWPDGRSATFRGEVEGVIATESVGRNGFGYDPVFIPVEGDGRSFAQMSSDEKHAVSHRARALRAAAASLTSGS